MTDSENTAESGADLPTLDPPGTIAIVGAGPFGLEAALYGRFLGYAVTVLDADEIVHSLRLQSGDGPLPMLPDRSLSPLAASALEAQSGGKLTFPQTIGEWIQTVWQPLTETDLLRGRVKSPAKVASIDLVEPELDEEDAEEVPPDFLLAIEDQVPLEVEAVILATSKADQIERTFDDSIDYFFSVDGQISDEASYWSGLKRIVGVYASLAGREDLDLYRPQRG